jgi:hypothetical protein
MNCVLKVTKITPLDFKDLETLNVIPRKAKMVSEILVQTPVPRHAFLSGFVFLTSLPYPCLPQHSRATLAM